MEGTGECPVYEVVRHGPAPSEPDLWLLALREQDLKQVELHLREQIVGARSKPANRYPSREPVCVPHLTAEIR